MLSKRMTLMAARLARPVLTLPAAVAVTVALAAGASGSTGAQNVSPAAAGGRTPAAPAAATVVLAGGWKLLPAAPVTALQYMSTSVWTGSQMIIYNTWLGRNGVTFAYRPASNTWTRLAPGPTSIVAEGRDVAVWTGREMLVIGLTSAAYTPATNTWRPLAPRTLASRINGWTGHEAIYWNGTCCGGTTNRGGAYNPAANTWRALPTAPLQPRASAEGAWTGKELVVAGGVTYSASSPTFFRNAAAYNPASNTWRRLPLMPRREFGATAVWDGKEVLFLGGRRPGAARPPAQGLAFNPATNHWRKLPAMAYPRDDGFAAVWTGRHVLVWGGMTGPYLAPVIPPHGESYNLFTNRWSALPKAPLHGRIVATSAWTGHQMIVWGGYLYGSKGTTTFLDGAAFTPRWP